MSVKTVSVTTGTDISSNRVFGCCISPFFNGNTARMFVATHAGGSSSDIKYSDYNGTTWGAFTSISGSAGNSTSGGWLSITSTNDGTRIIMGSDTGSVYISTWNGTSYSALTQVNGFSTSRTYSGVKVTGDGSRLVVHAQGGLMWFSTWDGSSNYNTPTSITVNNTSDSNFAMTKDGTKIVYAGADNKLYLMTWGGTSYGTSTLISSFTATLKYCAIEFSTNDYALYATNANSNILSIFVSDSLGNNYNTRSTYATAMVTSNYNGSAIGILNNGYNSSLYIVDNYNSSPSTLYNYKTLISGIPESFVIDVGNSYLISTSNLKVSLYDSLNVTTNNVYYLYSTNGGNTYANSNVRNNGPTQSYYSFYVNITTTVTSIYVKANNSIGESVPVYKNWIWIKDNLYANTSVYIDSNVKLLNGVSQYSFPVSGLENKMYSVYLRGKNNIGYSSNTNPYSVTVYTTPVASITFDSGNTKTVAGGNLQVSITDSSNISLNGVYYAYSLNGTDYISTNISANSVASGTTYKFYISPVSPPLDISNTIYVRATNTVGNSFPAANLQVIVYQTPRQPPQVTFQLVQSGNVRVSIIESASTPIPYYYLNNVSYYLYAYNNANGTNLSGNTSLLIYNKPVGVLSNTDATYGNVVSYVNTGLTANTYTMYLIATNSFGNSIPYYANINVYTTPDYPPKIDIGNTISATSGNLTVSFTDSSNNTRNAISYWYYVYDSSAGTNNSGNISYYANSTTGLTTGAQQSFPLYGFTNKTYTLYLLSRNVVGNSSSSFTNVTVYTVPTDILIDTANVRIVSSGNLQVLLVDPYNGTNNGVYYQYSINGVNGNAYSNSNAQSIGNNTYRFYISGLSNATYTINVVAKNTVGTSNANTFTQLSYVIPQYPPIIDQANTLSKTSGNLAVSFIDTSNVALNNITYTYYLYDISAGGTNYYTNTAYYTDSPIQLLDGITQYSFPLVGFPNKAYTLYLRSKNTVGYSSNSISYNVTVFTTPTATVTFDSGNTKTVASGNLQVRLIDLSNTSLNAVSYQYAINGTSYINSNVVAGTSPYTFYIAPTSPALDISNTIYVRATNTVGNSSPAANLQVIVYQTPRQPPQVTFQLVQSGNVRVSIIESATTPIPYYYLNNVSYYLYAYNNANGTNLSGNTSLLVYNKPVGILSNTDATYGNVVSYVNTGLTANTYTMYLIATNSFGNSAPYSYGNINVYTTPDYPPKIDIGNTISATAGNLTVSFTDSSNNTRNAISYWYYVYDSSTGTNNSGNISYYANSTTVLTTGAQQSFPLYGFTNKTYTLYLRSVNPLGYSTTSSSNVTVYTVPTDILIDAANIYTISSGNLQVSIIDPSNGTNNGVYYQYSVNAGAYVTATNTQSIGINTTQFIIPNLPNGSFIINVVAKNTVGTSNANTFSQVSYVIPQYPPIIDQANTLSKTSGNLTVSLIDTSNIALNNITYAYYLYDISAGGTNYYANTAYYTDSPIKLLDGTTQYSFPLSGFPNKAYTLYLRSKNTVGYSSNSISYNVTVFTTPTATVTFDSGNTKTVASGNLQVRLIDLSNTSLNAVSYQYAINGTSYINSNVVAGTSPYTFYIAPTSPALDISNTIYVRATNTVGNSSPAANLQVIVYQTPRQPPQVTFQLVQSGNVRVSIIESAATPIPYYYLNNVSYYLYAYNNANGTNLSGNTSLLVYNKPVGILSNTDATYGNVVSYVNTGLTANTYTMYLIATNSFGNSIPYYANINVYTTPDYPPKIDIGNTISATSGNLTVSFTDSSNNTQNAISYWYYVYDSSAGTNNSGNIAYYANSTTVLTTGAQQSFPLYGFTNKTYTLYLLSRNVVGNSSSSFTNVTVYTVPTDILIDTANITTVSSGNLQVLLVDPYNGTNNGVYYQYSINGVNGNAYSNSNAQSIGNNTYRFYISGLTNATYTINVVAKNTVGTSNANTFTQLSYVIPQYPPIIDQANTLSKTSGNLAVSFIDTSNVALNNITYTYYLYDISAGGTNYYANTAYYTDSPIKLLDGTTQYSFPLSGFPNKAYTLYLRSKNTVGYSSNSISYNVTVFTTPTATVTFDSGNTKTVASGNLQVRLIDLSNTSLNAVSYQYAINGTSYINSNVVAGTSPYTFYIAPTSPALDISNTIYVRATNTVGNSSPAANLQVIVYQTPRQPPQVTFQLVQSGNVRVSIIESATTPIPYYYLNNVSYYLYAYNNANGTNLSGNTSLLVYNKPVGILSNTDATYGNVVSYVNTGLTANTYTMYLIATNSFGNSIPYYANINVYTTPDYPPKIDIGNTISATSGNLTVSFTDSSNNTQNAISYWYYVYDSSTGTNNSGNISYYANSTTVLTTGAQQSFPLYGFTNKTYTLYLLSRNVVGYSNPIYSNVTVYTIPNTPTSFDTANTITVKNSSGNLKVSFFDTSNGALNNIYYWYSTDNSVTYSNTYIQNNNSTNANPYTFYISSLQNIQSNIAIKASNTVGNSAPLVQTFTVLQTPRTPPYFSATLIQSGNVLLTIRETTDTPRPDNYYLNGVSYYYYLYTNGVGDNLSANLQVYTNLIGNLTNAGYPDTTYLVSGLSNNTSTFYIIAKNNVGYSNTVSANVTVYTVPNNITIDSANTKTVTSGNLRVSFVDLYNSASNGIYYKYSTDGTNYTNANILSVGSSIYQFFIPNLLNTTYTISVIAQNDVGCTSPVSITTTVYTTPQYGPVIDSANTKSTTSGNLVVSIIDSSNSIINGIYYLYSMDGISYGNSGVAKSASTTYQFTISNTGNASIPLVGNTYNLIVSATNTVGNIYSAPSTVQVYTLPIVPIIDEANTKSTTSGNLTVSLTDSFNSTTNGIYYLYSTDGITYGNSGVAKSADTTYQFTISNTGNALIPLVGNAYSLYIKVSNPTGNAITAPSAVNVYTTPVVPIIDEANTKSTTSGNLTVSLTDSFNSTTNGIYYLYSTDGITYGNSGVAKTSNVSYQFTISNTGNALIPLVGNAYSLYIKVTNPTGNAITAPSAVNVYTLPIVPIIDEANTKSTTSGNLVVSIIDSSNSTTNGIYYLYSTDDITYGNSGVAKSTDTTYQFTISNTGNALIPLVGNAYSLYIKVTNPTGNAITAPSTVNVYTTPVAPIIDEANTKSTTSGNLVVSIIDSFNSTTNGIYYLYSTDGITYGNSGVAKSADTTYQFTISNTGNALIPLVGNAYSLYIKVTNPTGNAITDPSTVNVYTLPIVPMIDEANTKSTTSGNLVVSIIDSSNSTTNGIYYLYSTDGISYGNSGVAKTSNVSYQFTISNTGNALIPLVGNAYSLYIKVSNPTGNAITAPSAVNVYTLPIVPIIDEANTKSTTSGNLTISLTDSSNSTTNGIYYLYSTDGITYGNSGVAKSADTTYQFTISNTGNALIPLVGNAYSLYIKVSNPTGNAITAPSTVNVYTLPIVPIIDEANTKSTTTGNLTVSIIDSSNSTTNGIYYLYSTDGITYGNSGVAKSADTTYQFTISNTGNALIPLVGNAYSLYIKVSNPTGNAITPPSIVNVYTLPIVPIIDEANTKSTTSGNLTVSIIDSFNSTTDGIYYLYSTDGITYGNSGVAKSADTTYQFTISNTGNALIPLVGNAYSLYIKVSNPTGNAITPPSTVNVYTLPIVPIIDEANTKSTTPGNLTVSIIDSFNSTTNGIYYLYSTDDITYGNSGVAKSTDTTYQFTISNTGNALIPLVGNAYSLYIKVSNPTGNAITPPSTVNVYTLPIVPIIDEANTKSTTSGNLTVSIIDSSNSTTNGIYYLYSTDGITYGNSGVAKSTDTTYQFTISNTGNALIPLVGNVYSLYIKVSNVVGNTTTLPSSVQVYTLPIVPIIDQANTKSTTSGNLTVSLTDSSNSTTNGIYYLYSTDGITYGNSGVAKTASTTYQFTISNTGNALIPLVGNAYSLYIKASNVVGNTTTLPSSVQVYTLPIGPIIDEANTKSTTSGNLTVSIIDSSNSTTNGIYYLYSMNDSILYGNSRVAKTSSGFYQFTISNTGNTFIPLTANTYTLKVIANNPIGNAISASTQVNVYTTPVSPIIDNANTYSSASNQITVSFRDTFNSAINQVYYLVSIDGNTYANTGIACIGQPQYKYSYTITTNVTNGNSYIVRLNTSNPVGNSAAVSSNAIDVFTVPDSPTLYNMTPQISAIDISFSPPAFNGGNSITKYQYYLNGDLQTTANITITNQSGSVNYSTISSLVNGNTYIVGIRAINARGVSAWSITQSAIPFDVPTSPVLSTTAYDKYIRVFVSPPNTNGNAITSYQYALYGNTTPLSSIVSMGLPSLVGPYIQYDISGLINATTYNVVVRALNARGYSAWSNTVPTIPNTVPDPPTLISAISFPNAITISFVTGNDGGSNIIGYYYSIDNGNTYSSTGSTATQYTISGLTNGITYTIRVKNENKNGVSTASNAISVIPFTVPASPTLLNVISGIGAMTVVFRSPTDDGGNAIVRYEYSSNNGVTFASIGLPILDIATNTRSYTTNYQSSGEPLMNGQSYPVIIRAVNARGNSPNSSNTFSVTPFDVPGPPTLISAIPGKELINIVYSAPANNGGNTVTQYEYLLNDTRFFIEDANTANQANGLYTYTYTGLEVGDTFSVAVVAWNARGNSVASGNIIVIPQGPPQSPIIAVVPQDEYVEFSFNTPNDRGNAIVRYEYSIDGGNTYANISPALPVVNGKNVFNVYGLTNGNAYTVAVRSVNLLGTSPWSNMPGVVPYTYPTEPTILEIIPLREGIRVILDSNVNTGGNPITGYKYAYSLGGV